MQAGEWIWAASLVCCFAALALAEVAAPAPDRRRAPDDKRLLANFSLGTINLALGSVLPVSTLAAAAFAATRGIGLAHVVPLAWPVIFLLALVARSLVAYWVHRLSHAVPLLWRFHRVHHADGAVDVSTALRNHPVELALTIPAAAAVTLLLGPPVSAVLAVDTLLFAIGLWQHADIHVPGERAIGRILVTPGLHRTHHARARAEHDRNYGDLLVLWDRLFGTWAAPADRAGPVGLEGPVWPERLIGDIAGRLRRR